jgi:hypothetical protein
MTQREGEYLAVGDRVRVRNSSKSERDATVTREPWIGAQSWMVGVDGAWSVPVDAVVAILSTASSRGPTAESQPTEADALRANLAALVAACEMVQRRWTFDGAQQHTHSWHDMADCMELIVPAVKAAKDA